MKNPLVVSFVEPCVLLRLCGEMILLALIVT